MGCRSPCTVLPLRQKCIWPVKPLNNTTIGFIPSLAEVWASQPVFHGPWSPKWVAVWLFSDFLSFQMQCDGSRHQPAFQNRLSLRFRFHPRTENSPQDGIEAFCSVGYRPIWMSAQRFLYMLLECDDHSQERGTNIGRGRDTDCSVPPAQIRTGGFPASGSYLR